MGGKLAIVLSLPSVKEPPRREQVVHQKPDQRANAQSPVPLRSVLWASG